MCYHKAVVSLQVEDQMVTKITILQLIFEITLKIPQGLKTPQATIQSAAIM